jgi:phage anti-repressor protein
MACTILDVQSTNTNFDITEIKDQYIKKVFEVACNNINMLTIKEFIELSQFPIDSFMVDNFFINLNEDVKIYVSNELIDWCGFNGKEFSNRKLRFGEILQNFKKGEDYWTYSNSEYEEYYYNSNFGHPKLENKSIYPHPDEFKNKNRTQHMLLTVNCFKEILMMLNTPKAAIIRKYYISLETLIKIYAKYQYYQQKYQSYLLQQANKELHIKLDTMINEFKESRIELKMVNSKLDAVQEELKDAHEDIEINQEVLEEVRTKLDVATDDRVVKTKSITKRDKFVVLRTNDPASNWIYYAVRVQHASLKRTLKKLKNQYPNSTELIGIEYQPNGINFFNLVKEKLKKEQGKIAVNGNKIRLLGAYTEAEFLNDIRHLDMSKKDVDLTDDESE